MGAGEEVNARAHFGDTPALGGLCPVTLPASRQPAAEWAHTVVTGPLEGRWDWPGKSNPRPDCAEPPAHPIPRVANATMSR